MTQDEESKKYLVVVGMNRPRLNKIISLVDERQPPQSSIENNQASLSTTVVPCLAAMSSYKDENGNSIRYLSNVIYHDGSPMTKYFDDPAFRDNLDSVLLVGYEWQDQDDEKIKGYFLANQLDVLVKSVDPNPEFQSLHEEMEAFKILDDESKDVCLTNGTMGPGKMAKAIIDAIAQIENSKAEEIQQALEEAAPAEQIPEEADKVDSTSQEQTNQREPPDPNRPRYACRICRTILFGENHLAQDHVQNLHSFKKFGSTPSAMCQSLFCSDEVLQWLSPSGEEIEGKLTCPRCSHKIGHWKWAGAQCSCGTWVTPAIQIPVSKVDIVAPTFDSKPIAYVGVGVSSPEIANNLTTNS